MVVSRVDESLLLRLLTKIVDAADDSIELTVGKLRTLLAQKGWECDDELWKSEARKVVREISEKLLNEESEAEQEEEEESPPPPPKKQKKEEKKPKQTKYERMAEKNLATFMGAIGGDGDSQDEEYDDDEDDVEVVEEVASEASSEYEEDAVSTDQEKKSKSKEKGKGKAKEKEKKSSKTNGGKKKKSKKVETKFKSKEILTDTDSDGLSDPAKLDDESMDEQSESEKSEKKEKDSKGKGVKKANGDSKKKAAKSEEGKSKSAPQVKGEKVKKEPPAKEGDQPKGSEEEEGRIKKLKALLSAAGTSRAFTPSTGAERTLTVQSRLSLLEGLLSKLGLKIGKGGALPSMAKATAIGEKRALEKELSEISGVPKIEGLRGGKKRQAISGDEGSFEGESGSDDAPPKKKPAAAFGAFLGDQSDSD